jgi:hypothetical protein
LVLSAQHWHFDEDGGEDGGGVSPDDFLRRVLSGSGCDGAGAGAAPAASSACDVRRFLRAKHAVEEQRLFVLGAPGRLADVRTYPTLPLADYAPAYLRQAARLREWWLARTSASVTRVGAHVLTGAFLADWLPGERASERTAARGALCAR